MHSHNSVGAVVCTVLGLAADLASSTCLQCWLLSLLLAFGLQVAWLNAEVIAAEMLALVQVRAATEAKKGGKVAARLSSSHASRYHRSPVTTSWLQHVSVR
jgi:hypothetical protein